MTTTHFIAAHPHGNPTGRKQRAPKNPTTAWLLWVFLGFLGVHRYYLGDWKMAIPMTLTLGCMGIWSLIDGFFVGRRIRSINGGQI